MMRGIRLATGMHQACCRVPRGMGHGALQRPPPMRRCCCAAATSEAAAAGQPSAGMPEPPKRGRQQVWAAGGEPISARQEHATDMLPHAITYTHARQPPPTAHCPQNMQVFRFRHFEVHQGTSAHKLGTDSMLLGAWAHPRNAMRMLDVGTGSGVLAIMLAQRAQPGSLIDAIDIDAGAAAAATANAAACPWAASLRVHHASLQEWVVRCTGAGAGQAPYDLIISNPPYFLSSSKPTVSARAAARHADVVLPFEDLAAGAAALLASAGQLAVVLPAVNGEAQAFECAAAAAGLALRARMSVFTRAHDAAPKRLLLRFVKAGPPSSCTATHVGCIAAKEDVSAANTPAVEETLPAVEEGRLVVNRRQFVAQLQREASVLTQEYRDLTHDFHHPDYLVY